LTTRVSNRSVRDQQKNVKTLEDNNRNTPILDYSDSINLGAECPQHLSMSERKNYYVNTQSSYDDPNWASPRKMSKLIKRDESEGRNSLKPSSNQLAKKKLFA